MKIIYYIISIILLIKEIITVNELYILSSKSWCWTKPIINDLNFILNPSIAGINWGYCKPNSNKVELKKDYTIYVRTSNLPNSEAHGTIMISLRGTESTSKEILLTKSGFKAGSFNKIKINAEDVGNLFSIKLIAKDKLTWRCSSIRIESQMNFWDFECDKPLKWPQSMIELNVVNLIEYTINVKTSSFEESGTILPVYISLVGSEGKSPFKLLGNKGFGLGTVVQKKIKTIEVGFINEILLLINGNDNWTPEEIVVSKTYFKDGKEEKIEQVFKNYKNEQVIGSSILKLSILNDLENNINNEIDENLILKEDEANSIIKLSCYDTLKGNDYFGPIYDGYDNHVNYENFIVECPSDCLYRKDVYVYGLGIHPEESSICMAAIVDRATSFYGGLITVNIYKGLEYYKGGVKIFGSIVSPYTNSKRSFTVSRLDNIDITEHDVRIINYEGKHSNKGRLEIRYQGIWGTVCANKLGDNTANVICKQLGFKEGHFLNPKENEPNAKYFCKTYNGMNYCGVDASRVLFSNINCKGDEISIMDCYKEAATLNNNFCSNNNHAYDTLIECDNIDEDTYIAFKPNTIRLIDMNGNPTTNGIGRLEILRNSWGTVCDNHNTFNNKAASIACKQMGYLDGTIYTTIDDSNVNENEKVVGCSNVLGYNLCGDLSEPIQISDIICKGFEKVIKDCKSNFITLDCTHNNDIILKCTGLGDPTGKSQNNQKQKIITPSIKRLPLPPPFPAKCDSTPRDKYFYGDPGSVFMVNCPNDCDLQNHFVYGTAIYTFDSSICRSAIHSGVLTQEGGDVILIKTHGQNKYYSNTIRGITSLEDSNESESFFLVKTNSGYDKLVQLFNSEDNENIQLQNTVENKYESLFNNETKDELSTVSKMKNLLSSFKNLFTSFIEKSNENKPIQSSLDSSILSTKDAKAIFEWTPSSNTDRFDNSYIDLTKTEDYLKLFDLKIFTYYIKIQMDKNKDLIQDSNSKQTIFSIGGCEGYSIIINKDSEIIFDIQCSTQIISSGLFIPVNYPISFGIVFDSLHLTFYLNDRKILERTISLPIHFTSKNNVNLGKSSQYESDFFKGKIIYFAAFNEALDSKTIKNIYLYGYTHPEKTKKIIPLTLDDRPCISTCFYLPIPGKEGCPEPPLEAITYEINGEKTYLPGFNKKDFNSMNLDPFISIKCTTSARELFKENIKVGLMNRVKCPSDCSLEKIQQDNYIGGIFGTTVYTLDSMICYSAIHSGVMNMGKSLIDDQSESNMLLIKVLPGLKFYQGSKQYEIQSTSIEQSDFSFTVEQAPPIIEIECNTTLIDEKFSGTLGSKFLVKCPSSCSKYPSIVFGNEIYSGDSSICQSAIHAGAMNDKGGEVKFEITKGLKTYFSSKSFGIESKEKNSYVKSIKFFTSESTFSIKFVEDCSEKSLDKNWYIIDDIKAFNYPSKWECVPNFMSESLPNKKIQTHFLKQSKKIKSNLPMNYGTIMLLKNQDLVSFTFKVSFYFNSFSPVGMIFRYKDEDNYYHLRINNGGINKIIFAKKFEGKDIILGSSQNGLSPRIWYTFIIKAYFEKFNVYEQIGELRNNNNIISISDNEFQRGSVGVASDGNDAFYMSEIYIDDYDANSIKSEYNECMNCYSFDELLKENDEINRIKYCQNYKKRNTMDEERCKDYHVYCKLKCNEIIHIKENILNYACYKTCLSDTVNKMRMKSIQMNRIIGHGLDKSIWSPKEGEKCDYLPNEFGELSSWVNCTIISVKDNPNDPEQKLIDIKYQIGNADKKIEKQSSIIYPNVDLKKCGEKISDRNDCDGQLTNRNINVYTS